MGFKLVSLIVNDDELGKSRASAMKKELQNVGVEVVVVAYVKPITSHEIHKVEESTRLALRTIGLSGARVIINYLITGNGKIYHETVKSLEMDKFFFHFYSTGAFTSSAEEVEDIFFLKYAIADAANLVRDAFHSSWSSATTIYDPAIHGEYNPETHSPLFDENFDYFFDTDYATVGDGLPDFWGQYCYDTVFLYAYACQAMINNGSDPLDGNKLKEYIVSISQDYVGVTGLAALDPISQDREQAFTLNKLEMNLVNNTLEVKQVATINEEMYIGIATADVDVHEAFLVPIVPSFRNRVNIDRTTGWPIDGRALDPTKSFINSNDASETSKINEERRLKIELSNSFRGPIEYPAVLSITVTSVGDDGAAVLNENINIDSFELYALFNYTMEEEGNYIVTVADTITGVHFGSFPFVVTIYAPVHKSPVSKTIIIIIVVLSVLVLASAACALRQRIRFKKTKKNLVHAESSNLISAQKVILIQQEAAKAALDHHAELNQVKEQLQLKEHSAKELQMMRDAIRELSNERSDELRSVLIKSADIVVSSLLGQGGFGVVYLGKYKGKDVAVKQLINMFPESIERFRFECFLMKGLRHTNVIALEGVVWDDTMLACILEFAPNGSLEDNLRADFPKKLYDPTKLTWRNNIYNWALGVATGVSYLHGSRYFDEKTNEWKNTIIHRDLKPDNFLIASDFVLKLTDFGESRAIDLDSNMTSVGTPIYIAPEVLMNDRYDAKADSYSFAICLIAMLRLKETVIEFFFEALRIEMKKVSRIGIGVHILNNRMHGIKHWRPRVPKAVYPALRRLIRDCWDWDPAKRPTFEEIVSRLRMIDTEIIQMPEPDLDYYEIEELDAEEVENAHLEEEEENRVIDEKAAKESLAATISHLTENCNILLLLEKKGHFTVADVDEARSELTEAAKKEYFDKQRRSSVIRHDIEAKVAMLDEKKSARASLKVTKSAKDTLDSVKTLTTMRIRSQLSSLVAKPPFGEQGLLNLLPVEQPAANKEG